MHPGRTIILFFCLALCAVPAAADTRPVVAELFTSQGCSSCPPADALLAELAARPGVLALSFHVDYWDRLGWKDPFSSAAATERQHRYARVLGLATVYTPQIVVDGRWQTVGSDRAEVEHALTRARPDHDNVPIALTIDNGKARIMLGPGGDGSSGSVLLIGFDRRHVTRVERGENGGRTLAYADVVRGLREVSRYNGRAGEIETPVSWKSDRVAAVLQAADGRVLGVAVSDAASDPPQ
jgi:hypothetical protein